MYQTLTFTQLRGLLTERAVVGRSKATTKEKAIALLEECDRLSAENAPVDEPELQNASGVLESDESPLPNHRFYLAVLDDGKWHWLDSQGNLTPTQWEAASFPHRAAKAKAAKLRYYRKEFADIEVLERRGDQWFKHDGIPPKNWRGQATYNLLPIDLYPKTKSEAQEETPVEETPMENPAEQPKFRTESEFSGDPSISETAPLRTVEVTSAILETAPCFRLDVSQIENLLTKLVNKSINRQRGEDVAFVNAPKDLASGVDRAISSYLTKVGFDFMGRINLTAKYVAIDAEVQSIVSSPLIDTIYGWEIHSCGVCYGKPSSPWKFIFQPQLIFNEMSHALVADLYEIATTKLRTKLSRKFFGPLAIDNLAALRGPQLPEWLATPDGHWHVRWKPEHIDVFRWWWSQSSGGCWKLDYSRVISEVQGYRCLCGSEHCKHLGIVEKFQQKLQQVERQKQFAELEKKRQSEFAQTTKEREKLIEFLRENHFKLASDIGFALFRQPFWSLSLNHLKQINQEILSQVKQP